MTEAETIELIKTKKQNLAAKRAKGATSATLKKLEEEIKTLEATVPSAKPKRPQQTFLDECAG